MTSFERKPEIANRLVKFQPRPIAPNEIGNKAELFANSLARLMVKKNQVSTEEFKPQITTEDFAKEEKYNPSKMLSKLDRVNKIMQWVRRGRSGCRCQGEEKSNSCRSRSCRNKDKQVASPFIIASIPRPQRGSERVSAKFKPSSVVSKEAA